jgi:glycosyltransferase involved in cell wall biosynthesis
MLRISLVTPSFNQAQFLEDCLLSVKTQGYPHVEHIVMDGGSTDGSADILKAYSARPGWEHLKWKSEPDEGQSDALNKALRVATGDIVGWLNADDRYRPNCFATAIRGFEKYPSADVLYGDYTYIDESGQVWRIRREIDYSWFILHYLHMLYIPTPSSFYRRRIFEEGNWIDTKFNYAMDYEFVVRLAHRGYKFQHIPALLADFRMHPASKTGAHADKQRQEHDSIGASYAPLLRNIQVKSLRRLTQLSLRLAARGLRYKEKLFRGYYFEQFRPSLVESRKAVTKAGLMEAQRSQM